jgi:hypothetical protein
MDIIMYVYFDLKKHFLWFLFLSIYVMIKGSAHFFQCDGNKHVASNNNKFLIIN